MSVLNKILLAVASATAVADVVLAKEFSASGFLFGPLMLSLLAVVLVLRQRRTA